MHAHKGSHYICNKLSWIQAPSRSHCGGSRLGTSLIWCLLPRPAALVVEGMSSSPHGSALHSHRSFNSSRSRSNSRCQALPPKEQWRTSCEVLSVSLQTWLHAN